MHAVGRCLKSERLLIVFVGDPYVVPAFQGLREVLSPNQVLSEVFLTGHLTLQH